MQFKEVIMRLAQPSANNDCLALLNNELLRMTSAPVLFRPTGSSIVSTSRCGAVFPITGDARLWGAGVGSSRVVVLGWASMNAPSAN